MRIHEVRKDMEYFLVLEVLGNGCRRWIEHVGREVGRDDTGIYIVTPISPAPRYLEGALCFGHNKGLCLWEKNRLNSEIVRNEEPETFLFPTWQEAYRKTHD